MKTTTNRKLKIIDLRCITPKVLIVLILLLSSAVNSQIPGNRDERLRWWKDAKLGFFVHWGPYAVNGNGEQIMKRALVPTNEYQEWVDNFKPNQGCMDSLVRFAKSIGMKYMVLTTRHHDGFCLFDTQTTNFNSVKSKSKRDFIKEYVQACRKYDMPIGFYYSIGNWRNAGSWEAGLSQDDYRIMADEVHAQVRELMSNYGKIDILWFDGAWFVGQAGYTTKGGKNKAFWRSGELHAMIRKLQPSILINNRGGGVEGDFSTPEGHIRSNTTGQAWETCMTLGYTPGWGYVRHNSTLRNANLMLYQMMDAVRLGGNFLLNVGPNEKGDIAITERAILEDIGHYIHKNGEAIYETTFNEDFYDISKGYTQGPNFRYGPWTFKDNIGYLHVFRWGGGSIILSHISAKAKKSYLLADPNNLLSIKSISNDRYEISGLPSDLRVPFVLKVEFDQAPKAIDHKTFGAEWLEGNAKVDK